MLLIYASVALGFSFLCSVAEAVLLSVTPSYIETLKDQRPRAAALLSNLKENIERPLAAILCLNTVAHTVGAVGVGAEAHVIWGNAGVGVASALMTFLILTLSEVIPKTIGAVYWRALAPSIARIARFLTVALAPVVWLSEGLTHLITRNRDTEPVSREEVAAMAGLSTDAGEMNSEETRVLQNLLSLDQLTVEDIMTPRTVLMTLPQETTVGELLDGDAIPPASRIPIYDGSLDKMVGFVLKSDILLANAQGKRDTKLSSLKRDLTAVSADTPLSSLFSLLVNQSEHLALVVDDYGGTDGLVTMEDLFETLLGVEIVDEADIADDMQRLARRLWAHRSKELGLTVARRKRPPRDVDAKPQRAESSSGG